MLRPPQHVPTLTEVIEQPLPFVGKTESLTPVSSGIPNAAEDWSVLNTALLTEPVSPVAPPEPFHLQASELLAAEVSPYVEPQISEEEIAQRVLVDVQNQIDGLLDFRLREALGPILARHSEALVQDLREELGRTMQDVVARSVSQELAKLRRR